MVSFSQSIVKMCTLYTSEGIVWIEELHALYGKIMKLRNPTAGRKSVVCEVLKWHHKTTQQS